LDEETFHTLSRLRGALMAEAGKTGGEAGGMLAVKAPEETILQVLREEHIDLVLANKNTPEQTVLSGSLAAIDTASRAFARRKVSTVRLSVAASFHSPLVAAARAPFRSALASVSFAPGSAPVYANTTATPYPTDAAAARELLGNQLARPVEWVEEIRALHASEVRSFLEVGPGTRVTGMVEAILQGRATAAALSLDSSAGQRSGFFDLAGCLAWLAARGHSVNLSAWNPAKTPVIEAGPRKGGHHTVQLCGATWFKPRASRAAAAVVPNNPPQREHVDLSSASNGTAKTIMSHHPKEPPATAAGRISPGSNGNVVSEALQITRESLAALQKMQEQTAQLHRQFLESQEQAHRTVHLLVEQQQRLLQASLGLPVALQESGVRGQELERPPTPAPVPVPVTPPSPPAERHGGRSLQAVAAAPTPAPVPKPPAPTDGRVAGVLLEVIAEKTGYPLDMLELSMALDADLGIDSIKRVEILSALQERLPDAPAVKPEHLGSLHTLQDIAAFLATTAPPPPAAVAASTNGSASQSVAGRSQVLEHVQGVLLEVIAEKTGYPLDMLEPGMALDADLGIDSIKRVEILSALQERLPDAPAVKPEHLGSLHTLQDIAAFLAESPQRPIPAPPARAVSVPLTPIPAAPSRIEKPAALERSVVRVVPLPPPPAADVSLKAGVEVVLTDDDPALAKALAERLAALGLCPRLARCADLARTLPASIGGLVILSSTTAPTDEWLRDVLLALKRCGPGLRQSGGVFVTVARLDGAFGLAGGSPRREPLDGGLASLAKTARHEWPEVHSKAIDMADSLDPLSAAKFIEREMFLSGPAEVGLSETGRVTLERVVQGLPRGASHIPFKPGELVVVSGGARGVTAEVAVALARNFQPALVLLGRSPSPQPEPAWLADLADEAAIKRELSRRTPGAPPRMIGEQARTILAEREIRATLERIGATGATVLYRSLDVRDPAAVANVLADVRREHGPVRGLVHGAGVLADAKIEDKTAEQFDAVYGTKVAGLRALLAAVGEDDLRALVLFSSSTARFGRAGQVDYAIANEVLNKLAWQEATRRPGCQVVSLNWGPWDGGMVNPALKSLFAREGIGVIPLAAGAELLVDELRLGPKGPREVVVLAAGSAVSSKEVPAAHAAGPTLPPALPLAFERVMEIDDFPVLEAHVLDGRPVLPMVLMLEWLAHAALVQNPGYAFHGCDDLRVLQGVPLEGARRVLRVGAGKAVRRDGFFIAAAELRSQQDGREVLHARAEVVLANSLPAAPPPREVPLLPAYPHVVEDLYRDGVLFHGPALQCIEHVEGCGAPGIVGVIRAGSVPSTWLRQPLRQHWLSEPLVIDGSFQLLILWSRDQHGAGNLPCHVRRYRQYRRAFPTREVRVAIAIDRATDLHALADIDYLDGEGKLIARIEGYECVIDPTLERAFKRNILTPV
jgi:malonyl CoA-acyl carrier protein transacylase